MVMDDEWKNYKGDKGIEAKTREIKSLIMNDEKWDSIDYFLKFTEPIVDMLRSADIDGPKLHSIYDVWDSMIEKVKKVIFERGKISFPVNQRENGIRKLAPNEDIEISLNRVKCFQSGSGYFSEPHVIEAMMYEDSLSWWANHGRNKLVTSRAEDLVFVHYNLRLLSRKKEKYINGPSKYWDVGGDRFDIDETTNDLTELSIDEPQIEGVIFEEEFEEVEEDVEDVEEIANLIK
ncbi:hypothetical protein KY290_010921 [Solanum tuberosum]|uniref:Uncharacterized protein n=1 Tax=Solanum tuberosum TaxID=4113 RepID=A0ABQ7VZ48_SOLTU|nr:hypothetical protein KY290_010921 [Solanum tuberosum]